MKLDQFLILEIYIPKAQEKYPSCIAGKNDCPPEDCGGVG